jgi:BirA family transcriptional regulator, biotin operon repressor / biotin---[acetyl-CoA-carboxylase] ligase
MTLDASRREVPELVELDTATSTNAVLLQRAGVERLADYTTVVTTNQTAGRGRLDRRWEAPAGTSLAVSVLIRPVDAVGRPVPPERLGWLSIAAGVAMTETVTELLPERGVTLKWPNDVLVGDRKVSGILAEAVAGANGIDAVVVGVGLNLVQTAEQLPVPTATSLALEGADTAGLADRALADFLRRLRSHAAALLAAAANADHSGLRDRARELCGTLGGPVRVELPGADPVAGTALDIDEAGRLVVGLADGGGRLVVAAGDVVHLRHG